MEKVLTPKNIDTLKNVVNQLSAVLGDLSPQHTASPEFQTIGLAKTTIQEMLDYYQRNKK